jgi:hypothetical protein
MGAILFELDLACLAVLLGEIMMPKTFVFRSFLEKGARAGFVLYQLPHGIAKFYLPQ